MTALDPADDLPVLPAGRFQVEAQLGAGGFGAVHRARDLGAGGRPVALKLLKVTAGDARARFRREAELVASLPPHPGIVQVHEVGLLDGSPCMVLELVEGARTLDRVLPAEPLRRRVERLRDGRPDGSLWSRGPPDPIVRGLEVSS